MLINDFFIRCLHPYLLMGLIVIIFIALLMRYRLHRPVVYRFSLGNSIKIHGLGGTHIHKKIIICTRFITLLLLAFAISRLQIVDTQSKVSVEGNDIVLVLDASGSMQFQDYDDDNRSRFDVAKQEAIRFIEKRDHDALGLVLFGKDAISRCPITFDKQLLKTIVDELKIGVIDSDGTMLITAIVTAANRLKHSKAKSKVMIVLTDGEPSEGDMDPSTAIEVTKKLGIKVYTVGIGSEQEQLFMHPLYGWVTKPKVNKDLLTRIAQETGGSCFMAHNARDMRSIYDTIDKLEKTEHDVPIFSLYYDLLYPLVGAIIGLAFFELLVSTFVWFAL